MISKNEVLAVFRKSLSRVSKALAEAELNPDKTMREQGVDSLDSVLVLYNIMTELRIKVPLEQLSEHSKINEIADKFVSLSATEEIILDVREKQTQIPVKK